MGIRTGNPAWVDSATEVEAQANPGRKITAAKLNAIEAAIDDSAEASHQHDARYVRTVNGTGPDGSGDVVVSGGGSATWDTLAGKPAVIAAGDTAADARTAIGAGTSSFSGAYSDLSGRPALSDVATSGDYDDLTGKPTLGTAAAAATGDFATAAQGTKADAAIPSGLVDAKGDLIVATADGTVTRLPASTNGHVLTLDSAESAGMKWAAPAGGGGGMVPLQGGPISQCFLSQQTPGVQTAVAVINSFVAPYPIAWAVTIDALACVVTSSPDAGAGATLMIYDGGTDGLPTNLVASVSVSFLSSGPAVGVLADPVELPPGMYYTGMYGHTVSANVETYPHNANFPLPTALYTPDMNRAYLRSGYQLGSKTTPSVWPRPLAAERYAPIVRVRAL